MNPSPGEGQTRTLRVSQRLTLFLARDPWFWIGFWALSDGYATGASVILGTVELGFEYIPRTRPAKRDWHWGILRRAE